MNVTISPIRSGLALSLVALFGLSACQEPEIILPGEREEIRSEIDGAPVAATSGGNVSRAISLPGQTVNKDWAQSIGTQANRVSHPALRVAPQLIWSASIGAGDSKRQRITADPVVAGGLIYTLDASARVTATAPNGGTVWTTDMTPPSDKDTDATGGGMAYSGGMLYVSSGYGLLVAIEASTGKIRWRQRLEATGSGTPTVKGNLIYLVAGDDTGWAVEADSGRIAWQVQASPSVANVLGAPAPALTGQLAVFAFGSGDLIGTFQGGGLRRWNASVAGQRVGHVSARIGDVTGSPVVVGNTIYAGNHSGRIVALSADLGERIWTAREGALGPVWPVGGSIFAVTDRSQLARISTSDGSVIWAVDLPGFVKDKPRKRGPVFAHYGPILAGGRIVVASNDGYLRFFAPEDGSLSASVPVPGGATTAPVVANKTLYVVGAQGQLHAFR